MQYKLLNFPLKKLKEGSAEIFAPVGKISKKLPVFYNPVMKLNRDITILLLKQFPPLNLCDPLSATGVRSIRFAKELKYKSIIANDISKISFALIKKNIRHNKVKFKVYNKDANVLLLESNGFDFIDLDVFGSPNFVLDSSIKKLSRNGILAVTATDTAALCGTSPDACKRKYWAIPKKCPIMHELGLRILIRKIQLIAMQYDKALTPIFSYFKDHYFRVFLQYNKGNPLVKEIISQHQFFDNCGPIWIGRLWDSDLVKCVSELAGNIYSEDKGLMRFLNIIQEESKINRVGFFDMHNICKIENINPIPKKGIVLGRIAERGYSASSTHFKGTGIRADIEYLEFVNAIKNK